MIEANKPILRAIILSVVAAVVFLLFYFAAKVPLTIFGGILFAVFLRGLADPLSRRTRLSPGWSLLAVVLGLAGVTGGGALVIIPRIAAQFDQLLKILPPEIRSWFRHIQSYDWGRWLTSHLDQFASTFLQKINFLGTFDALLEGAIFAAVVLFLGIYLSLNPGSYRDGVVRLMPAAHRDRARGLIDQLGYTLRWWMIGRAIAMLFVGVLDLIAMLLLQVPLALTIALISGLLTFIPYIGAVIAMVPAVLIALTVGPRLALWVFIVKMVVQMIEGYIITPLVQRKAVHLPPALTISAQFLMGTIAGVLGLMFATPLTAIGMAVTKMLYLHEDPDA
jgi:predicted PurR-regulated permease PerM